MTLISDPSTSHYLKCWMGGLNSQEFIRFVSTFLDFPHFSFISTVFIEIHEYLSLIFFIADLKVNVLCLSLE